MLIRLRSPVGTWRMPGVTESTTVGDILDWVKAEHSVAPASCTLSTTPNLKAPLNDPQRTVGSMGLKNGTMLYLGFDSGAQPSRGDQQSKKQIAADGSIVDHRATQDANAFRPGLLSLRSQKMHWSLADMNDLDNQYTFTIKRHDKPMCARVSLDRASCNSFQQFCRKSAFQTARCGILYGHLSGGDEAKKAAEKGAAVSSTPKNPKHRRISDLNVKQPSARRRNAHGNIN